ncbi:hypothetical protein DM860_012861 [Cuscuta australis]|uniref:SCP domain-containing protein n=1 Tax=Cuscuta australis TaxID=267555 RepID=A0A328DY67_9ASTE|nr:hypothetical protein DM860_012861 [Cuscuta australis]
MARRPAATDDENSIAAYLEAHNAAREGLTSAEEGLLSWNATLADYAENYAKKMASSTGCSDLYHSGSEEYGENLAWGSGEFMTGKAAVEMWVSEKANYTYATNSCKTGQMCGHYTQVVWKATAAVGCARTKCAIDPPGGFHTTLQADRPGAIARHDPICMG